jgi:hypothetical protein
MTSNHIGRLPVDEPLAALERALMGAYLAGAGQELHALVARGDEDARALLAEIKARSRYLGNLHHES